MADAGFFKCSGNGVVKDSVCKFVFVSLFPIKIVSKILSAAPFNFWAVEFQVFCGVICFFVVGFDYGAEFSVFKLEFYVFKRDGLCFFPCKFVAGNSKVGQVAFVPDGFVVVFFDPFFCLLFRGAPGESFPAVFDIYCSNYL